MPAQTSPALADTHTLRELLERLWVRKAISSNEYRLLKYLIAHHADSLAQQRVSLSEQAIATEVFAISEWTAKNTTVRVAIRRLRENLGRYFDSTSAGRKESIRLDIPKRITPYVLRSSVNKLQLDEVQTFWDAHFIDRPANDRITIVYTEPLFFWNPHGARFVRFLNINYEAIDPADLKRQIARDHGPNHPALKFEPSYHYQPGGEIEARATIVDCLRSSKKMRHHSGPIEMKVSRDYVVNQDFVSESLVVLGNKRTSGLFRKFQEGLPITIDDAAVSIRDVSSPLKDDAPFAYAVLTRRPNFDVPGVVTLIGANHGRAAEKVANFVSSNKQLRSLYGKIDEITLNEPLPEIFQVLFRVRILPFDNPREIQPVLWWGKRRIDIFA